MKKKSLNVQRKYEQVIVYRISIKLEKRKKTGFTKKKTNRKYSSLLYAVRPVAFRIKLKESLLIQQAVPSGLASLPVLLWGTSCVTGVLPCSLCAHQLLSVPGFLALAHLVLGSCFPACVSGCPVWCLLLPLNISLLRKGKWFSPLLFWSKCYAAIFGQVSSQSMVWEVYCMTSSVLEGKI